jgi:hypothetical protein
MRDLQKGGIAAPRPGPRPPRAGAESLGTEVGTPTGTPLAHTLKQCDLSDAEAEEVAQALQGVVEGSDQWAWVELNYRPHAYQRPT